VLAHYLPDFNLVLPSNIKSIIRDEFNNPTCTSASHERYCFEQSPQFYSVVVEHSLGTLRIIISGDAVCKLGKVQGLEKQSDPLLTSDEDRAALLSEIDSPLLYKTHHWQGKGSGRQSLANAMCARSGRGEGRR